MFLNTHKKYRPFESRNQLAYLGLASVRFGRARAGNDRHVAGGYMRVNNILSYVCKEEHKQNTQVKKLVQSYNYSSYVQYIYFPCSHIIYRIIFFPKDLNLS